MECHTSLCTVLVYVGHGGENVHAATFKLTSRVPVDGKSSVCVICMKYRIIFLIIIFISLGQIILSYMANTSRTHARTHAHTRAPAHTHRRARARAHSPTAVTIQVIAVTWAVCAQPGRRYALFSPVPLAMNGRSA